MSSSRDWLGASTWRALFFSAAVRDTGIVLTAMRMSRLSCMARRVRILDTKLAMADVAYDVLLETGVLIQPLPIWEEEWEHPELFGNRDLLRNIRRDGVRL